MARRTFHIGEHALPLGLTAVLTWLVAALTIRALPGVFEGRLRLLLLWLASFAVAEVLLRVGGAVLAIEPAKRIAPAAWFAAILLVCHAFTLVFWPSLYGANEAVVRHGSAWIIGAAAAPILLARFWAER